MWKVPVLIISLFILALALTFYLTQTNKYNPPNINPETPAATLYSQIQIPKTQVIAKNLEVPWALAILPSGSAQGGPDKSILVTERAGRVRIINTEGELEDKPLIRLNVKQTGESGLHGITIHPDFAQNGFVYLYYTYGTNGDNALNRVSRFTFTEDSLNDEKIIVDKIPGAIFHDGGRIKFGPASPADINSSEGTKRGEPDGYLYITTGDALNPSSSQDKNSLAGKILRVTDEGESPPGNPFGNLVYSYGHRNPQGITWDDQKRLWETEHGQSATDELNLIEPGKNYGWPGLRGEQTSQNMISPKLHSGQNTWAPSGVAYFSGSLFFGGLRGQALFEYNIEKEELKEHFKEEFGRIRDVVLGPDNLLYITTSNRDGRGNPDTDDDKIIRIDPKQL